MKRAVIYLDLASVPAAVVSEGLAFFLAFLCSTPEHLQYLEATFAASP